MGRPKKSDSYLHTMSQTLLFISGSECVSPFWRGMQCLRKQPKNLQAILGGFRGKRVSQNVPADAGCSKCERKCKVSCPLIKEGNKCQSTRTQKIYNIRQKVDCDSEWVIYLITCKKCSGQYVGKSKTKFKIRHSNHKQEVKKIIGGLGGHYGGVGGCGYQNM